MRIFYSDINSIKSEKLLNVNMLKMEKKYDIQNTFMAHGILFIYAHKKLHASLTRAGMNILLIEVNWNLKGYVTSSDHTQSHLSWTKIARPAASMMMHRSEFLNYNQFFRKLDKSTTMGLSPINVRWINVRWINVRSSGVRLHWSFATSNAIIL